MLEKLQKYFNALNEAVLGKRLGTAPFRIAGNLAPEFRTHQRTTTKREINQSKNANTRNLDRR